MDDLLERLRMAGLPLDDTIREAMKSVDLSIFTEFDLDPFWHLSLIHI